MAALGWLMNLKFAGGGGQPAAVVTGGPRQFDRIGWTEQWRAGTQWRGGWSWSVLLKPGLLDSLSE